MMTVFHTDLDNTLIYSYKREIGPHKRCVELYQGREVSFMTEYSYERLREVNRRLCLVPTTTRSVEQYQRIDLGLGGLRYVLAANGGVLLIDGRSDERWYEESLELAAASGRELERGSAVLERDEHRSFELRRIHGLFLFTKSSEPEESVRRLRDSLDGSRVDVFHNGIKVYVIPKAIDKGTAVRRFRSRFRMGPVIAAGDSEFDIPMLLEADVALAARELGEQLGRMETARRAESAQPSGRRAGLEPTDRQVGLEPTGRRAGLEPSDRQAGLEPSDQQAGLEPVDRRGFSPELRLGSGKRVFSDELLDCVAELTKQQMKL